MEKPGIAIDYGRNHDWSLSAAEYAKYRDNYPAELYNRLRNIGIGLSGQTVVDLGTGTGVIPRNLGGRNVKYIGIDPSAGQLEQARQLTAGNDAFTWIHGKAEETGLPDACADAVTASMCFVYFDKPKVLPEILRILKPGGIFVKLTMLWLPYEDDLARATEEMVLKYNPVWTGGDFKRVPGGPSALFADAFTPVASEVFDAHVPFTRETWRGRIRACRGMGASTLPESTKDAFDKEFAAYLEQNVPEEFTVLHQVSYEAHRPK